MLSTEPQVIAAYVDTGKIRYVYYPMLDIGGTQQAYEAAECAGAQGAEHFWSLHDLLYAEQSRLFRPSADLYVELAQRAGVPDLEQFRRCVESGQFAAKATELDRARRGEGIRFRPTFKVGDQVVPGAQRFERLAELIDAALAQR